MTRTHPIQTDPASQTDHDLVLAQRRKAIDLIATTRTRMVRCCLFATFLLRPHPTGEPKSNERAEWRAEVSAQNDALNRVIALLTGHDPAREVHQDICDWIAETAVHWSDQMHAIHKMQALAADLTNAAQEDDVERLDAALNAHQAHSNEAFFAAVTEFCDALWADLDRARTDEIQQTRETGAAIAGTLKRLEHIGKHVRLVSLNASVEASRVGDAGKGLGVIAVEFKALAEEIQKLAETARHDVASLSDKK